MKPAFEIRKKYTKIKTNSVVSLSKKNDKKLEQYTMLWQYMTFIAMYKKRRNYIVAHISVLYITSNIKKL